MFAHRVQRPTTTTADTFAGPVKADETHVRGKTRNMHAEIRRQDITGRGGVDKAPVVGVKDRTTNQVAARVVDRADSATLQGFDRLRTRI